MYPESEINRKIAAAERQYGCIGGATASPSLSNQAYAPTEQGACASLETRLANVLSTVNAARNRAMGIADNLLGPVPLPDVKNSATPIPTGTLPQLTPRYAADPDETGSSAASFSDDEREREIQACYVAMNEALTSEGARIHQLRMYELIQGRSAARIAQMEAERKLVPA